MTPLRRMLLAVLGFLVLVLRAGGLYLTQPAPLARKPSRQLARADPGRLQDHVEKLSGEFAPRSWDRPDNLDRTADYIRAAFQRSSARVSEQPVAFERGSYRNVIASFGPAEGERIVVGAHYDAYWNFPGADDNASGVAALLELAGLLSTAAPTAGIDLVAFTLEEPPAFGSPGMGSAVHAASLRRGGVPVRLMICLEMLGFFSDRSGSQSLPMPILKLFYPGTGNFIAVIGRAGEGRATRHLKTAMRRGSD